MTVSYSIKEGEGFPTPPAEVGRGVPLTFLSSKRVSLCHFPATHKIQGTKSPGAWGAGRRKGKGWG